MDYHIILYVTTCLFVLLVNSKEEDSWIEFKKRFHKSYTSPQEETSRFSTYLQNLRRIQDHNSKYQNGEENYFLGVNQFSDLTTAEISPPIEPPSDRTVPKLYRNYGDEELEEDLPESFDWRDKGAVFEVRDQGDCYGASVAFSVTGSIEGRNIVKHGKSIELSVQCLLDCAGWFGDFSCDSYEASDAYNYIASQGIPSEASYPYVGRVVNGTCEMDMLEKADVKLRGYLDVSPKEKFFMKDLVTYGPISVRISTDPLQDYAGGVFDGECYNEYNSVAGGMLLIGYGTENGTDYWTLRNSWGTTWGEAGYLRLARNGDVGLCGIYTNARYPWLE